MAKQQFEGQYIWSTSGEWMASLVDGHLWDPAGVWIGWVEGENVYKADGEWIGRLHTDYRILRRRRAEPKPLHGDIPDTPPKPVLPSRPPLPPMFVEMPFSIYDVMEEDPDIFKQISVRVRDMD